MEKRPIGLVIVACLLLFQALLGIPRAIEYMENSQGFQGFESLNLSEEDRWMAAKVESMKQTYYYGSIFSLMLFVIGIILAYGLWNMKKWASTATMILAFVGAAASFSASEVLAGIIYGMIAVYMIHSKIVHGI